MFLYNGFNIFSYLSRDIIVFSFLSFIFSPESQVHLSCFLLFLLLSLLDTFLKSPIILGACSSLRMRDQKAFRVGRWAADLELYIHRMTRVGLCQGILCISTEIAYGHVIHLFLAKYRHPQLYPGPEILCFTLFRGQPPVLEKRQLGLQLPFKQLLPTHFSSAPISLFPSTQGPQFQQLVQATNSFAF